MKKLKFTQPTLWDIVQIFINIIAFIVLYNAIGGKGMFWQFFPLTIIFIIILIDSVSQKCLWTVKVITYMILTIKFSSNIGLFQWYHLVIICISIGSFILSRELIRRNIIKKKIIALWGQNCAFWFAGILYIKAVIMYPDSYNNCHITFWLLNMISYIIASVIIYRDKSNNKEEFILALSRIIPCFIYSIIIVLT
jgi:hypothetical protein